MVKTILIIEDNTVKLSTVLGHMNKLYPEAEKVTFSCSNTFFRYMRENMENIRKSPENYLLILDCYFPVYQGEFPEKDAFICVLNNMRLRKCLVNTIIQSSEEIDMSEAKNILEDKYLGFVKEDVCLYTLTTYRNLLKGVNLL